MREETTRGEQKMVRKWKEDRRSCGVKAERHLLRLGGHKREQRMEGMKGMRNN